MFTILKPFARIVLGIVGKKVSPSVKKEFGEFVLNQLRLKVDKTPNKWDNFLYDLIVIVLR